MSERVRVRKVCLGGRTKQAFKADCDVNQIMKRFKRSYGGDYLSMVKTPLGGSYLDCSDVADYRTALDQVKRADELFMGLPAKVRSRFANDAGKFLDFVHNPANVGELVELGLAKPKPVSEKVEEKPPQKQ